MKWLLTSLFLLEKFHGQRSLAGYSPWGLKESVMTEQLNNHNNKALENMHFNGYYPPIGYNTFYINKALEFNTHMFCDWATYK